MRTHKSFVLLALMAGVMAAGLVGCASTSCHHETGAFKNGSEIQCDVTGLHTLAADTPDYLSAVRGYGDSTGRRSVLLD